MRERTDRVIGPHGGHNAADLTGQTLAGWRVVGESGGAPPHRWWRIRGPCGHEQRIPTGRLRTAHKNHHTVRCRTCGHATNYVDMAGQTINGWTVVERAEPPERAADHVGSPAWWRVRCAHGRTLVVIGAHLRQGIPKRCRCR